MFTYNCGVVKELEKTRAPYPAPSDAIHPWAYVPDLAETAVKLAERRDSFEPFAAAQSSQAGTTTVLAIGLAAP